MISRPRLPLFLARTLKRLGEPGNEATPLIREGTVEAVITGSLKVYPKEALMYHSSTFLQESHLFEQPKEH